MSELDHPIIKAFKASKDKVQDYINILDSMQNTAVANFNTRVFSKLNESQKESSAFNRLFVGAKACQDVTIPILEGISSFLAENNSSEPFVQIFQKYSDYFNIYFAYVQDYHNICENLTNERNDNNEIDSIFNDYEETSELAIECALFTPIQHIQSYMAMIEILVKLVPPSTDDEASLRQASQHAKSEMARMSILFKEVAEVEEMARKVIDGFEIYKVGRRMFFKGESTKFSRSKKEERLLMIFSDGILIGKNNRFSKFIAATQYDICDVEDVGPFINAVDILTKQKSFRASFATPVAKGRILTAYNEVRKLRKNKWPEKGQSEFDPIWIPDELVSNCMLCTSKFTIINRKHHCRKCGNCICGKCCKKVKLNEAKEKALVCDRCLALISPK